VGLACSHVNNLRRKLVLTPKLFPIVSVKCGELAGERECGECESENSLHTADYQRRAWI
jgi:hypothetical protein